MALKTIFGEDRPDLRAKINLLDGEEANPAIGTTNKVATKKK